MILADAAAAIAAPTAHLVMHGDPGDFVSGGLDGSAHDVDIFYTPANSQNFSAQIVRRVGPSPGQPAMLQFALGTVTGGTDNTFAVMFFATDQLGVPIQPGTYSGAERASFASPGHPGIDISFQNRGCNQDTGSFVVDKAVFGADPLGVPIFISAFSVSFVQHCEGGAPALIGTFTYDAGIADSPTVPAPISSLPLMLSMLIAGVEAARRKAGMGRTERKVNK